MFGTGNTSNRSPNNPVYLRPPTPDAHHLRFAQHPALGRKVSDEFTVRCVEDTIVSSTAAAMKPNGGRKSA